MGQDSKKPDLNIIKANNWIVEEQNKKGEKKFKILTAELAEQIKKDVDYYLVKSGVEKDPFLFAYWNGVYKNMAPNEFKALIKQYIPYQLIQMKDVTEIYNNISTEFKSIEHEAFNNNENIINFQDGLLHLDTGKITSHTPKCLSTIQIPTLYKDVENATASHCPIFIDYLNRLVDNDMQKFDIIMQFLGLSISNIYGFRTKKALFLEGEGNTR